MNSRLYPVLLGTALVACTPPEIRVADPTETATQSQRVAYSRIEIAEISLPSYAANEDIAVRAEDGTLTTLGPLWADDPARAIPLQLTRDLHEITGALVAGAPWPFRDFPQVRVELRLEQHALTPDGAFQIAGQYFIAPEEPGRRDRVGRFDIAEPVAEPGAPAQVAAARRRAVSALAADIARNGLR